MGVRSVFTYFVTSVLLKVLYACPIASNACHSTRAWSSSGIVNELEISVHSWHLSTSVRDFQLGVVMGTRSLPSIPQMVWNVAATFFGLRGTPAVLTSVMVIRPAGNFVVPMPSRLRITLLRDPDAFGDVDDGGEDGADAISLTCYLYKLHTQ